ncbi:helix-turn-helix domain-containing protein [Nocardia sp. CA-119907]|uniref:helix-turn-helix domain-containing protein n=1 Tax=Nocardia sp. CA-119907 TaxID=3239973 RepID=UPI003D9639FF
MTSEDGSSTLPRRQLGRALREMREGQGLRLDQAAALAELSKSGLHRIENAQVVKVKIREIRALCEVYGVSAEETSRVLKLAEKAQAKSWHAEFNWLYRNDTFTTYVGLETPARKIILHHEVIPGLLQTADYARAMIGAYFRDDDAEDIEKRVELRLKRQAIVRRKSNPLELEVLLDESALHRVLGGPRVMAAQLRQVAEMSKLPNLSVRIVPFTSGCTWGLVPGGFLILDFGTDAKGRPVEPPLVYREGNGCPDLYMEHADDVQRYHDIAAALRSTTLDETQTRDLLRRVARSYAA